MKKIFLLMLVGLLTFGLVGCGGTNENEDNEGNENNNTEQNEPNEQGAAPESEYPFPEATLDLGDGIVIVNTPSGDSIDGNVPSMIVQPDTLLDQVGYDLEEWDPSKEVFVYVDKIFYEAVQSGEMYQSSICLSEDLLDPGEYTVSAIQFEGNDPEGEVTGYKEAKYEIEEGH